MAAAARTWRLRRSCTKTTARRLARFHSRAECTATLEENPAGAASIFPSGKSCRTTPLCSRARPAFSPRFTSECSMFSATARIHLLAVTLRGVVQRARCELPECRPFPTRAESRVLAPGSQRGSRATRPCPSCRQIPRARPRSFAACRLGRPPKACAVFVLARRRGLGRKRILPAEAIPVVHMLFESNDVSAANRLRLAEARKQRIRRRAARAAFRGKQLDEDRRGRRIWRVRRNGITSFSPRLSP